MTKKLKKGDQVEWNTPQGKTRGKVEKKITSSGEDKGAQSGCVCGQSGIYRQER